MAEPKTLIRLRTDEDEITALQNQQTINTNDIATIKDELEDLENELGDLTSKDIAQSANTVLDSADGTYKNVKQIEIQIATQARTVADSSDNTFKDVRLIKVNNAVQADSATTATTATKATTADSATTATTATTATNATKADTVLVGQQYLNVSQASVAYATNAGTADKATVADSANAFAPGVVITAQQADMVLDEVSNKYDYVKNIKMTSATAADYANAIVNDTAGNTNAPVTMKASQFISLSVLQTTLNSATDFDDFKTKILALTKGV